jgi:hypothetical protein
LFTRLRKLLPLALALLLSAPALARLGGGQSYSGGGGSHSGGSGGGGGGGGLDLLWLLFQFAMDYPTVGIPLILILAGVFLFYLFTQTQTSSYDSSRDWSSQVGPSSRPVAVLGQVVAADPNFSRPVFIDFLGLLYTRLRTGDTASIKGYLAPDIQAAIPSQLVIIGAIRIAQVSFSGDTTILTVDIESNLQRSGQTLYCTERWELRRKTGVLSKAPDQVEKLACPSCGNPGEIGADGKCPYCNQIVNTGRFDWLVFNVHILSQIQAVTIELSSDGQEVGTELPTLKSPMLSLQMKSLGARDPSFQWKEFEVRVRVVFENLQQAWSDRNLEQLRPYETDALFNTHRYWIEAYQKQHMVNRLTDVVVSQVEPVRVEPDAFYEAITVRVWASMKDSTVRESDPVKDTVTRKFSEYWTFIRRIGAHKSGEYGLDRCPSCGAPLDKIGMTGICGYCGSKVTRGDFDWVLSLIEQDEAYAG